MLKLQRQPLKTSHIKAKKNYDTAYARDSAKLNLTPAKRTAVPSGAASRAKGEHGILRLLRPSTRDHNVIESILHPELFRPRYSRRARRTKRWTIDLTVGVRARRCNGDPSVFAPGENLGTRRLTTANILCVTPWPYVSA